MEDTQAMRVEHIGTELSLVIREKSRGFRLVVNINGSKEERIIQINGKFPVHMFCPSVQGTVVWCVLKSGEEIFFDSVTGSILNGQDIAERKPQFYL